MCLTTARMRTAQNKLSTLCLLATTLGSVPQANAGFLTITDRNYPAGAPQPLITAIDQVFNDFETEINSNLPSVDGAKYAKGIANSLVTTAGTQGADYSSDIDMFLVGFNVGVGGDLGTTSLQGLAQGDATASDIAGAALGASALIGVNLGFVPDFLPLIDMDRANAYLSFMSYSQEFGSLDFSTSSFGLMGQYQILQGKDLGLGAAKWNGVQVSSGIRYNKLKFIGTQSLTESITDTIPGGSMTATVNADLEFGADASAWTIPIEVSSSARLAWVFGLFAGIGTDLSFGSSKGIAKGDGPIDVSTTGGVGTITANAELSIADANEKPSFLNFRYFAGTQVELGVLALHIQYTGTLNNTLALQGGVKAFW
jgi:hypothetical protein